LGSLAGIRPEDGITEKSSVFWDGGY